MNRPGFVLALSLFLSTSVLGASPALDAAVEQHQNGQFEAARQALEPLAQDPDLSAMDHVLANEYLASCYFSLKQPDRAKAQLMALFRGSPDVIVDPNLFFPELIVLAEQARKELAEQMPPPPPASSISPPSVIQSPESPRTRSVALGVSGELSPSPSGRGAWVGTVGYRFSEAWSAELGGVVARPAGALARGVWVPWNAQGKLHPLLGLEATVLASSPLAVGIGVRVGGEFVLVPWLALRLDVPLRYFVTAPAGTQTGWAFVSGGAVVRL